MGDAIQHGDGQSFRLEDLAPFRKRQIGRDHDALSFMPFAESLKEEVSAVFTDRQVAQLIDENQIPLSESLEETMELMVFLSSLQLRDQLCRGVESHALILMAGSDGEAGADMSFARAAVAHRDDVGSRIDVASTGQFIEEIHGDFLRQRFLFYLGEKLDLAESSFPWFVDGCGEFFSL